MLRTIAIRIAIRLFVSLGLLSMFVVGYLRIHDRVDSDDSSSETAGFSSTERKAQYLPDDHTVLFKEVAQFAVSEKGAAAARTSIKIDAFGDVYLAWDGSDIAIGDPGHVYSERSPVWVSATGAENVYYAMPREGRLVVAHSDDGGRTMRSERLIANGFRNMVPAVQGNLVLFAKESGIKLFNVFLNADRNELQLARCTEPCRRFTTRQVTVAAGHSTFDHPNPAVAVDYAEGIHVVFSDGRDVYLTSSADEGETWGSPVRINNPNTDGNSHELAIHPVVVAGDSGHVAVLWLEGSRLFAAYTRDAFAPNPAVHAILVSTTASAFVSPSAAVDPEGNVWIAFRSGNTFEVFQQSSGDGLAPVPLWSLVGNLTSGEKTRRLNVRVRGDMTGHLIFLDPDLHMFLKANRFKFQIRGNHEIAISGNGRLQNGTAVTFTVVAPEVSGDAPEIVISMNNGYFASGTLVRPGRLERNLHVLPVGGK